MALFRTRFPETVVVRHIWFLHGGLMTSKKSTVALYTTARFHGLIFIQNILLDLACAAWNYVVCILP